ncbi:protein timeless-like [Daphnia pulex]|uniref:protein timeless-like n=1 Tax=Daphnia pulex TaxID=6669 RepID=UPI001EDE50CA|nr:protein timeless-like [Daphnia pulex]
MEQLMKLKLSGDIPCLSSIPLGTFHNNKYYIDDECLTHLEEINVMLKSEDPNTCPLRRAIGFMDILNKDLIPILTSSKDQPDIFYSTIKLLVELTTPVECLVSVDPSNRISPSQHIAIHELTQLLYGAKESFLDGKTTQVILNHLLHLSQKQSLSSDDCELVNHSLLLIRNILHAPERPCQIAVGECQVSSTNTSAQQQNRILWNLYAQGLSHLLINLLGYGSQATEKWSVTIVQLISLFYKDRPVETIQNMLRDDIHSSESSEDDGQSQFNQSRRSSQESISSSVFHSDSFTPPNATPIITFSGEMDQQETGTVGQSLSSGERNNSQTDKSRHSSSEQSTSSGFHSEDSGILKCNNLTLKEHDGHKKKSFKRRCRDNSQKGWSNRTFHVEIATEHPANHVPPTDESLEKMNYLLQRNIKGDTKIKEIPEKEQSRKKLIECNVEMNQSFKLFQYQPTEKDIAQLVKEFTVDFLLNGNDLISIFFNLNSNILILIGYNTLVKQLHQQLLKQGETYLLWDKSHFFWLICYFLPIAAQLELSVEHLKDVLTIDLLCYLTWEAVHQTEELEICTFQPTVDLKPCVRRLHLSVTAIREYVQTLESYFRLASGSNRNEPGLLTGSEDLINRLSGYVPAIRDLRQLFLLQLRQFDPVVQSRRYLLDVIATNHILLLTLERSTGQSSRGSFNISQHLTQFCSEMIVDRYGTVLEDFKTNGPFVNDCILTILHHIAGDLGRADLLCRPVILRPFSKIWKEEFNMCDDWNDLIELIIQKSMREIQKSSIKETLRSNPNEPLEIKVSVSHLTETLPLKYSDEKTIEESTETNRLSYEDFRNNWTGFNLHCYRPVLFDWGSTPAKNSATPSLP